MSITIGSHIPLNMTAPIFVGPGSHIPVNLSIPEFLCEGKWAKKEHDEIDFDLLSVWKGKEYNEINFNFTCVYRCTTLWPTYFGNQVPLSFGSDPWPTYFGNQVPLRFRCAGGDDGPEYTLFTGTFDAGEGSDSAIDIATSWITNFYDGSEVNLDLFLPERGVEPVFYTGETLEFDFFRTPGFALPILEGSSVSAVLNTDATFVFGVHEGAQANGVLTTYTAPTFAFNFYTGETGSAILSADQSLGDTSGYTGETLSVILTDYPLWTPTFNVYEGAQVTLLLNTTELFRVNQYTGEVFDADITTNPAPEMLLVGNTGEAVSFALSVPQSLGTITAYEGASATIPSLGVLDFWVFHTGETTEAVVSTSTTLPSNGYTGESASLTIDIRPSENIGTFRGYTGEGTDWGLNIAVAIYLYPNRIHAAQEFFCEFDAITSFDLNNVGCCPQGIDTHERIELNDMPAPDERYDGDKTVVQMDLRTLPRFKMDFVTGEHFRAIDPNYMGLFQAFSGQMLQVSDFETPIHDFKLCRGNLIPNGDHVNVELISVYDEACEADLMVTGEHMSVELSNNIRDTVLIYEGQHAIAEVTIDPLILIRFYAGEYVRVSNPEFTPLVYNGEYVALDFEGEVYRAGTGEHLAPINLSTDYDVEFLERGCLDNEYVPTNENGDPDWDKFTRVNIEMEYFTHSIKARCF